MVVIRYHDHHQAWSFTWGSVTVLYMLGFVLIVLAVLVVSRAQSCLQA